MKRIVVLIIVALMLTASGLISIVPMDLSDIEGSEQPEADLPQMEFPTIWQAPYVNTTLAAEADESADSILGFAETTDDDIMWPTDLDRNVTEWYLNDWDDHVAIAITSGGQIGGGGGDNENAIKSLVDPPSASWCTIDMNAQTGHLNLTFELPQANIDSYEPVYFQVYLKCLFAQSASSLSILNSDTDTWETLRSDAITTSWVYWNHWIDTDSKYHDVDGSGNWEYKFRVYSDGGGGDGYFYIEWASLQFIPQTGSGYAESFADVSDYSVAGGASPSVSTDGDVGDLQDTSVGSQIWPHLRTNEPSVTVSGSYYVEICWRMSVASWVTFHIWTQDNTAGTHQVIYDTNLGTDWITTKVLVTLSVVEHIDIYPTWSGSETRHLYVDSLRIGPADEMGYQHDFSVTTGISSADGGTIASDDDAVTLTADGDGSTFLIVADTTATATAISCTHYPMFGIDIDSGSGSWTLEQHDGSAYATLQTSTAISAGTKRFNMRALDTYVSWWRITLTASGVLVSDWIKAYSIANYTVSNSATVTVDYVLYVNDDGALVRSGDESANVWINLVTDFSISVDTNTYNVVNITCSDMDAGVYEWNYRESKTTGTWHTDEEGTRFTTDRETLTSFSLMMYHECVISAIKYWEDFTDPTISTFTNTPLDPSMASAVTIESIASDGASIYTVEATAVVEPSGSSIGTVTMTLDYTTQGGAGIYSYTFSAGDLSEGRYTFELEVDDVANQAYEYLTFTVSADTQTTYIRIFDSLGDFVPFETFEVYRNGTRQYTDTFLGNTEHAYQIQVKDRWGETLNTTTFSAGDQELVVTIEVYSLKVMSWHYDFVRFNVTRAGLTYSEIVTPLEVINFRLYTNTYDWAIDYLNGSSTSGDINLTNSTALVVTGSTISDVYGLVNTVNTMTTAINITTTTISNEVVTVQLMFDWSNTTLYNQTINIIAAFNWENTTIYNQTVSIASLFNATNTVLYDQIILIQNMFNWENTTLYNQTISILNAFNATNTVLYSQTVSILADISNVNSTIYAQTVQMLLDLENSNSTLYDQTVTLLANIANVDSDIAAQTVTILADIENVNSTIYAQTVQMLTDINNMNSTIYSQTVMILSNLEDLNATVYLVDDPTNLNPLVLGHSLSDDYCDLTIVTNWHNASISVYDNDVLRTGPTSELLCPIRYPLMSTSGTHNLSIYVDAGNDSFWYNISYTVAEIIAFELEDWDVSPHLGVENHLECFFRTTWANSTVYVYLNDSLQTSVLEQEGGISFSFWMTGTPGLHQYVFNVTSGANVITITWDFYLPDWAETALVVRWDLWTFQNNYTMLELESNWMNCTYYIYLNSSLVATSANDPVTLNFTRAINIGTYNLTIYADGGAQTYTISNIRYIVTEEGVSYDFSTFSGGVTYVYGDTYEGDTHGDTHENPPGIYLTAETAATIAVSTVFIFFLAVLFMNSRVKKAQLDRDKKETQ